MQFTAHERVHSLQLIEFLMIYKGDVPVGDGVIQGSFLLPGIVRSGKLV